MKTRIIQTRFWDDEFVTESDIYTQHLYIYLLTSQYVNICGIFQLSPRKVQFETKLTDKQYQVASDNLSINKEAFFFKGWVFLVNAEKNNKYRNSPQNEKCYQDELSRIPLDVSEFFDTSINSSMDSSIHTNHNPKIINHKSEIINKKEVKTLEDINEEDLLEISESYKVPLPIVRNSLDSLKNYCLAKGRVYRDYKAALRNFVKSDAIKFSKGGDKNESRFADFSNIKG